MEIFFIIILGLVIGSFLNVCIYRIASEKSIVFPASHCTKCGYELRKVDLIPVVSYIFLKGKCRNCNEKISIQYPMIEVLNAILYLLIYFKFGFTLNLFKFCLFISLLIVIGMIDLQTKYVYNSTIILGVIFGVLFALLNSSESGVIPLDYILGAFIGFGVIYFIVLLTQGMGKGDIDISFICGLFLGERGIIVTLFLAIVLCGIVALVILFLNLKDKKDEIAFGPYLAIGATVACLYGSTLENIYLSMF